MIPENPYPIGYKFTLRRGKRGAFEHTVVDRLTTYNSSGEIVRFRYATEHTFLGQPVRDNDVLHTTIARASHAEASHV